MLELLLKLLDKIKELIETKEKRKDKVFERLIEPTYNELQLVHQDYLESLAELHRLLPSMADDSQLRLRKCEKATEFLESRRIKFEGTREKLRGLDSVLDDHKRQLGADCCKFLEAVARYIFWQASETNPASSRYQYWLSILRKMKDANVARADSEYAEINRLWNEMGEITRSSWQRVSAQFAEARIKAVSR